jgi:hypothetical protein
MINRSRSMLLLCLCFNAAISAQEKVPLAPTKVQIDAKQLRKPQPSSNTAPAAGNTNSLSAFEAFSNIVVPAGQSMSLTSLTDWTGADRVSIAISCPTSTSLQNAGIAVQWGVPLSNAPYYTTADLIQGKNLHYSNMGGAVVPAYGNQLQLVVINNWTTGIACDQVTVYAVVH